MYQHLMPHMEWGLILSHALYKTLGADFDTSVADAKFINQINRNSRCIQSLHLGTLIHD